MRTTLRHPALPSVLVFVVFVFGFTALNALVPPKDVSVTERRNLAQRPEFTVESLVSGEFTEDYADFMRDQAALRDPLRFLKSFVERRVFQKVENNGVYVVDDFVYDKFYGITTSYVTTAAQRMNDIIDDLGSRRTFLSMVPTKAHGLDRGPYLLSDQHDIADTLRDAVDATYIDLMGFAGVDTEARYYGSDPHWTTRGAIEAYRILAAGLELDLITDYEFEEYAAEYVGSEYGKAAAWGVPLDSIETAHNNVLDSMSICRIEDADRTECYDSVYVEATSETVDLYDVFLGGLGPIIEITNPRAASDADLVIFKDSYAHAVAPFLAQHYRKTTLIDLRYVQRDYALDIVDFSDATVLFLYGTSVINTDPRILN